VLHTQHLLQQQQQLQRQLTHQQLPLKQASRLPPARLQCLAAAANPNGQPYTYHSSLVCPAAEAPAPGYPPVSASAPRTD
jgi:hypothetical protein